MIYSKKQGEASNFNFVFVPLLTYLKYLNKARHNFCQIFMYLCSHLFYSLISHNQVILHFHCCLLSYSVVVNIFFLTDCQLKKINSSGVLSACLQVIVFVQGRDMVKPSYMKLSTQLSEIYVQGTDVHKEGFFIVEINLRVLIQHHLCNL